MCALLYNNGHSAIVVGSMRKNSQLIISGIVLGVIEENGPRTVISGAIYPASAVVGTSNVIDDFVLEYIGTSYPKPDEAYAIVF